MISHTVDSLRPVLLQNDVLQVLNSSYIHGPVESPESTDTHEFRGASLFVG